MNKLYCFLLLFLFPISGFTQQYGNEWIDYSHKYYRFSVTQTGLHKIDYNTLVAAGITVSNIPTASFQIFGKEAEVPLYIFDNNDNSFDPGDYFLFAATKNDGWMDSSICINQSTMANPAVSLINDTIHYFFSWSGMTPGKRFTINSDNDFASQTPIPFVVKDVYSEYRQEYFDGNIIEDASASAYTSGEGYGNGSFTADNFNITQYNGLPTPNHYNGPGSPFPVVHFRSSTASHAETTTIYNHHLRVAVNSTQLLDSSWSGYKQMRVTKTLPNTLLANSTNLEFTIVTDVGAVLDRQALTYYTIRYPRTTNSSGAVMDNFFVPNNSSSTKSRIDLTGFGSNNTVAFYSQNNQWYLQTGTDNAGTAQFLIPNNTSGTGTDLNIYSLNHTIPVTSLTPVNGNGTFHNFSLEVADSMLIMITSEALASAANNYKTYRESAAGGSFPTVLALFSELTDQFGGGVPLHPGATRRFAHFFYNNSTIKPAGLFLIGKGISPFVHRSDPATSAENMVPCLGYPGSDIALTSGLETTIYEPLIPTGRISVVTNQELEAYLAKVIEYEDYQNPNSSNFEENLTQQKQILHFVGGATAQQQSSFQGFMNTMKTIAEDSLYAGNVTSYFKSTSDPLDPAVVAGVTEKIADGVSLMTFFGHAAQSNNGFEINIDDPSNWNNAGKYPFVIGNSCHNGDIYAPGNGSTSERFVNVPQEGAISFISSVGIGFSTYLFYYSSELYRQFSNKNYGKSFGYQIQQAIKELQSPNQNLIFESTYHQMALNGDPLLRINAQEKPEIIIKQSDISFSPSNITLEVEDIAVTFTVRNIGRAIYDSVAVEIRRDFPGSNTDSVYMFFIPRLNYDTTITKTFPLQPEISGGINQFTVSVDIPSYHPELFEETTNNTAKANFFIPISGINPIWPYNYAVVPYDTITVKASTINPIAGENTYLFELDTTDTYDSPQLRRFSVTELGGVKQVPFDSWKNAGGAPFPLICSDSTVYFWRVAVDSSVLNWSEFSFQYIEGKTGWGQDHFFQFKNNSFSVVHYNRTNRLREFLPGQAHTMYAMAYDNESWDNQWGIDGPGNYFDYATVFGGEHPGLYVGVLDPITLEPWYTFYGTENPDHDFGNGNTQGGYYSHSRPEAYFAFNQDSPAELAAFENMIENEIPNGHLVTIYSVPGAAYSNWTAMQPSLYDMFTDLGSTLVNSSQPEKPFAMIFRMGDPASLVEKHYPDTISTPSFAPHVLVEFPFVESDYMGIEKTPLIGPAFEWQTLYWKRDSLDLTSVDSVRLRIERYDINQALQNTIDLAFTPNDSLLNLDAVVDAASYPYIRLNIYNQDGINFTPAQIDRLHVLYSPVPEAAIDGTAGYFISPNPDSLNEGQQVSFAVDIRNVSDYDMDSLLVTYQLEDMNHQMHSIPYVRQKALLSGDVFRDTVTFTTLDFGGYNGFWMEVNPYINGSLFVTDQPEQYHFNNILNIPIQVTPDDEHPVLDVTFNGRHILNNDIVDPESEIVISLKDDNPYLIMSSDIDTTLFGIYLTDPSGNVSRIPFMDNQGNIVMQWYPANAQSKKFKIVYPAAFQQDGMYTLLVQGTDRSGNISGDYEYRVKFEIIRESSITHMMNYPNPFSTSTRFVFTLTGTEEPEDVLIQIMTVSGRVVREISEDQLGQVFIGRNISEYAWDGTDEFGDPLANGVYLYRVKAKINGEDIKHRESGADQYFKEEFGKMYLMR